MPDCRKGSVRIMKLKKKAVLFDLDGVLFDTEYMVARFMVEDGEAVGIHLPFDVILSWAGKSQEDFDRRADELLKDYGGIREFNRLTAHLPAKRPPFREVKYPYVTEMLEALKKRGYKTAVCSASSPSYVQEALEDGEIAQYIDYVISGHDLPVGKPDPTIYLNAMDVLGVKPEESVVVEDSAFGIEAGKRAGCTVVGHYDPQYHYDQSRADIIVDDYRKLMDILL